MKIFVFVLSAFVLQVSSDGLFDLLDNLSNVEGIPQSLPIVDSEGMSNIKNVTSEMSQITNNLPESIATKLGVLVNESAEAVANIPSSSEDGPLSIAIQGAKRALGGVKDNVLDQLMDSVEKVNLAVANLTQTATNTCAASEIKIQTATHPMDEYVQSRLRVMAPGSDIANCLKKVKDDLDDSSKAANLKVSSCISEKVDQGKNATSNIDVLVDDSRNTIQKYVSLVKECVVNLTAESTQDDKNAATSCLVTNSGKIVSREFTTSIQIATQTSTNLEAIKNAENSIQNCVPDDLIQTSFDFDAVQKAADACTP